MTAVRVVVSGRVQGVNFRWYTLQQAERLGVHGWVRNLPDGRVEAVIEGGAAAVDGLVAWMHQGPPSARVDDVTVEAVTPAGLDGFRITW